MLKGMAGSVLGIWVAHGEGRMVFRNSKISSQVISDGLATLRYVDDSGHPTVAYPFNPNGTEGGIAALCSDNGRHLAVMPHPERCVLPWQWPWMPVAWQSTMGSRSPWMTMFTNAYEWCQKEQI
ncbi:putative phosphoribosylformylglycinamidine synthase, chloroplastic/mitochondrial [Lamellibrachia satsuma]|nr:putative phosphoribosylformylglycinamidine synthase, chloroplastic/mitochondrial [Lamellibrachia satsuma]